MSMWSTRKQKKKKQFISEEFPDYTDDFIELLQQLIPKAEIATGWPLYRRGGSARPWDDTSPENNYVPTGFTQIGIFRWSGSLTDWGSSVITLPRGYANKPLCFGTVQGTDPEYIRGTCMVGAVSAETIRITWHSSYNINRIDIAWLTFGPGPGTH